MQANSNNSIAAIVVTYNPVVSDLNIFLLNLSSQVDKIIIVDNASKNINELLDFQEKIPNIVFIKNNDNEGLAFAQNQGVRYVKDILNFEFLMVFDQDSNVDDNFVSSLYEGYLELKEAGNSVAAVGPVYYDAKTNELYPATKYVGPFIKRIEPSFEPVEVTFIIASGSLIPVKMFDEVGIMNEDFFIDYIDVEWCLRAKSKGFGSYMVPKAKMIHTIGDNRMNLFGRKISIHSPLRRYYLIRNSFIISKLNYIPFGYKLRELVFNLLRFFIFILISENKKEVLKFSLQGFHDGVKGKVGKRKFK